ncbi:type II secretion system F family protein, partial [bacterium]|nr:type II secretion system F family protein [candidate division CSSED10-310 bacterium]
LIRTGESSGTLPDTLDQAATILEMNETHRRHFVSALTYPAVILTVTLLAALFLATVIAPQISDMYARLGHDIPLYTRLITGAGTVTAGGISIVVILMAARRLVGRRTTRRTASAAFPYATRLARLRWIRTIICTQETAVWTYSLGVLLKRDIPLPDALALIASGAASSAVRNDLTAARRRIIAGESPADAFSDLETVPVLARRILQGGDRIGELAAACDRVYRIMDSEARTRSHRLLSLAEPVAVVIAGICVIAVALAVIIPIAELGGIM